MTGHDLQEPFMNDRNRSASLAVPMITLTLLTWACSRTDPLYCDTDADCKQADRPFCIRDRISVIGGAPPRVGAASCGVCWDRAPRRGVAA